MLRGTLIATLALSFVLVGCSDDTAAPDSGTDAILDIAFDGTPPDQGLDVVDPDIGPDPDGCVCALSVAEINGAAVGTKLSALDDQDANTSGIQINVKVAAQCAEGETISLAVTGLSPEPTATVSGGFAEFTDVTVSDTNTSVTIIPKGTGCSATSAVLDVVPTPTCTFTDPADGSTLTAKDDSIPGNGEFNYSIKTQTTNATGGQVTLDVVGGSTLGTINVDAATGEANFLNQKFDGTAYEITGKVVVDIDGTPLEIPCTVNGNEKLSFTIDTTAPSCKLAGFTPAEITTTQGPGLGPDQDAEPNTPDLQTVLKVETETTGVIEVTLTAAGQTYTQTAVNGVAEFSLTVADGSPSFYASCVDTATQNEGTSGITKVLVDTNKPAAVSDLNCFVDTSSSVSNHRKGILTCEWTTPDDGTNGSGAVSYELNCAKNKDLVEAEFATADLLNPSVLHTPVTTQSFNMSGLAIPDSYSCALKATDFLGNVSDLSNITPQTKFEFEVNGTITGSAADEKFATYVVTGDFNCDSIPDMAVGVNTGAGQVNFYWGTGAGFQKTIGLKILGTVPDERFGAGLTVLDYNGDGCSDLLVRKLNSVKKAYLYLGRQTWTQRTDDSADTGAELILNDTGGDQLVNSAAFDYNGDGFDDIALTVFTGSSAPYTGEVYVIFGANNLTPMATGVTPQTDSVMTNALVHIKPPAPPASFFFGASIVGAKNIMDATYESLAIGSFIEKSAYILTGGATPTSTLEITDLTNTQLTKITGETSGAAFGFHMAVGDVVGDTNLDLIVSDPNYSNSNAGPGKVYVFDISQGQTSATQAISLTNNTTDHNNFGFTVHSGKILGQKDDLVIYSKNAPVGVGVPRGAIYIYTGLSASGTSDDAFLYMCPTDGSYGYGNFVDFPGDVNGDGYFDFVITDASYSSPTMANVGRVLVYR